MRSVKRREDRYSTGNSITDAAVITSGNIAVNIQFIRGRSDTSYENSFSAIHFIDNVD